MSFGSDNQYGGHSKIIDAIINANHGILPSYGADYISQKAKKLIGDIFETNDFDIYYVATGGAANCLALASLCPTWGSIICHTHAHIIADEANGPQMITGGAKLLGIGQTPRLEADEINNEIQKYSKEFVHGPQPKLVSITNLNENGLYYKANEIQEISKICKENDLWLHCDGARFANAIIATNQSPKELSWASGIDALSFGLTKNGAIMAEALLIFGKARNNAAQYIQKSAQHLISKNRFISAQYIAMLENGLWLELAKNANDCAKEIAEIFKENNIEIITPPQGNEVFVNLSQTQVEKLQNAQIAFYPWQALGKNAYRFVTAWATSPDEILQLKTALGK